MFSRIRLKFLKDRNKSVLFPRFIGYNYGMIQKKLQEDQYAALKKKDVATVSVLRYVLSQIKNREIEKKASLTDEEVIITLRKHVKELNESIESFKAGGRADLVAEYEKQLSIITPYLPEEISDEELSEEIQKLIQQHKDMYEKNPKALIGICVKELKSKAEPSRIIKLLNTLPS